MWLAAYKLTGVQDGISASKDNSMFLSKSLFFAKSVVFLTFDEKPHPRRVNVHQLVRSAENVLQDEKIKWKYSFQTCSSYFYGSCSKKVTPWDPGWAQEVKTSGRDIGNDLNWSCKYFSPLDISIMVLTVNLLSIETPEQGSRIEDSDSTPPLI